MRSCWILWTVAVLVILCIGCDAKGRIAIPTAGGKIVIKPPLAQPPASSPPGTAPSSMSTPTSDPILAEDATGVWNQSQVEQYLMEDLKLVSVSIQNAGGANYRGTAVAQDGRNLTLAVQQVPGGIHVDYADDRGGSGSMSFGNPIK